MRFFSFLYFLLYFSLSFLGVSLHALNPLEDQEFLISYRLKIVDSRVMGEEYSVSKPIVSRIKTAPYVLDYHCSIITRNLPDLKNPLPPTKLERFLLEIALKKEKERVIDCILKSQVAITHYDHGYKNGTTTTSILDLKALSVRASLVGDALFLDIFRKEEE